MGMGKGSSTSSVQMTPEQQQLLKAQADFLTGTAFPAYQKTIGGAQDVLNQIQPYVNQAALGAYNRTGGMAEKGTAGAENLFNAGVGQMANMFDPQYEQNQINAALQAGREATREQLGQQNAMYGAAGGLGSSRQALADTNLRQLGAQRQATAAAGAQAQVQQNRLAAANQLFGAGQNLANISLASTGQQLSAAQAPQDIYSKYASVVYGTPQQSTTPNFAGTQGQTGSSKGSGIQMKWPGG